MPGQDAYVYRYLYAYVYTFCACSVSDSGKVKLTVQRGLEQIRLLKNHGMHPRLVTYLATNFGQKVQKCIK